MCYKIIAIKRRTFVFIPFFVYIIAQNSVFGLKFWEKKVRKGKT